MAYAVVDQQTTSPATTPTTQARTPPATTSTTQASTTPAATARTTQASTTPTTQATTTPSAITPTTQTASTPAAMAPTTQATRPPATTPTTHETTTPAATVPTTTHTITTPTTTLTMTQLTTVQPEMASVTTLRSATRPSTASLDCGSSSADGVFDRQWSGNQQCGSTFTFNFGSVDITNITVHYSYADWEEIRTSIDNIQLSDNTDNDNSNSIISSVIKIELIDGNTTINLSDGTIQIEFMIQSTEGFPPTVRQIRGGSFVWSAEGLEVVSVDSEMVVCNSTHLTSFAVLLSLRPPDGVHAQVQSYLSYILGGISIASLTLAVFIYCVTGTCKMLKIQIHMNLAICTALGQTLFLVLAEQTDNKTFCKGVTATLHYVFTSALAWTVIEGVFLYRTTAVGFKPLKIGWLCILAYGKTQ
nr:G8 domain-containing protein DDB_G0286311-like [Lytechinus pictus]